jgi:anti-anti-sigma factor
MVAIPDVPRASAIKIQGRVTVSEVHELRRSILADVATTSSAQLVLDLGGVEQMDTAGAAVLIEAIQLGKKKDLKLLLCSPSESVIRMFQLAGLEDVLDYCCENPQETMRRLLAYA